MVSVFFIIRTAPPRTLLLLPVHWQSILFCLIRANSLPVFSISSHMLTIFLKWEQLGLESWITG